MDRTGKFVRTLSIEQFKGEVGIDKIQVRKNPVTGTLFFTGVVGDIPQPGSMGAVSSRWPCDKPVVSYIEDTDSNGEIKYLWLLHQLGEGGAEVLASL